MYVNPLFGQRAGSSPCACGGDPMAGGSAFNFGLMAMMMTAMMGLLQQCLGLGQAQGALPGNAAFGGRAPGASNGLDGFLGGGGAGGNKKSSAKATKTSAPKSKAKAGASSPSSSASNGKLAGKLPKALKPYAGDFEKYGKKYGVDPRFLAAISMLETGGGTSRAFRSGHNAMGVSNSSGPISFKSVGDSIEHMARVLGKKNGAYGGKSTISQIASVYCPVGAGNDVNGTNGGWPSLVSKFYKQLGGNPKDKVK